MSQAAPSNSHAQPKPIKFRGRSFVAFVLSPEPPLKEWLRGLDRWIQNSPGFFSGRPVVVDLNAMVLDVEGIGALVAELLKRGIRTLGIEGADAQIAGTDLPPAIRGARPAVLDEPPPPAAADAPGADRRSGRGAEPPPSPAAVAEPQTLIVETPIRSGQSVIYPYGDVVVLGSVGSGAEIVAAGSIHVYGTLRGRALAGAMGNAKARIFTRRNEAELLAVDGCYRTADTMEQSARGKPVQCFLDNGVLWVAALEQ